MRQRGLLYDGVIHVLLSKVLEYLLVISYQRRVCLNDVELLQGSASNPLRMQNLHTTGK